MQPRECLVKAAGVRLAELLGASPSTLLEVKKGNLEKLQEIQSILVVGSSGAGKTTVVNMGRELLATYPELGQHFEIPKRVITRPMRENDDTNENIFAKDDEEFDRLTRGGVRWERDMGDGRIERYGFVAATPGKMPIYSANSAILANRASVETPDPNFFDSALIFMVHASDDTRARRLAARSPDLVRDKPEEAKKRLEGTPVSQYENSHLILQNPDGEGDSVKKNLHAVLVALAGL